MAAVLGIWIGLAGVLPVLAGLTGIRRVQRLRREGVKSWAVAEPQPPGDGARRVTLRYALPDERVLEQSMVWPARKIAALRPGQSVLIWYDPADPLDILVYGRQGRVSDLVFVIGGAALILFGAVIGVFAPLLAGPGGPRPAASADRDLTVKLWVRGVRPQARGLTGSWQRLVKPNILELDE